MIPWTHYSEGNHRIACPACARKPNDKTLGLTVEPGGRAVAHCFRCEYVETYRPSPGAKHRSVGATIRPAQTAKHEHLSDYGQELWKACSPTNGPARAYLKARHCALPPEDGDLRCHPALKHPSGYVGPALIALVTDAVTREPMSLHRTWIQSDGRKADVDPPRLLLGGHRKQGGVIRLWPDECVTYGLAIAEGIETALSIAHDYKPVWSVIDAGNMAAFPVLLGIQTLVIGADHDPAGLRAANTCADMWTAAGVDVRVIAPESESRDWNDARAAA